jgi:hypothetical protein
MAMSFWDLLQRYRDATGASEAWVMRKAELNKGTFSAWRQRGIPVLPARRTLVLLSAVLKVDYELLVATILTDAGYLPGDYAVDEEIRLARERRERKVDWDEQAWAQRLRDGAEPHRVAAGRGDWQAVLLEDGSSEADERVDVVFGRLTEEESATVREVAISEALSQAARRTPSGGQTSGQRRRAELDAAGEEGQEAGAGETA